MVDDEVIARIHALVDEEHRLHARTPLSDEDHRRLADIEVEVDQCWDLLRQRRALRRAGLPAVEPLVVRSRARGGWRGRATASA
jgi:Protein of unknown function (DUF2630)